MNNNQLKLNDDKTEALLFVPPAQKKSDSLQSAITVGNHSIQFSPSARNLGFMLDSELCMQQHIKSVCQLANYELRRIGSIRKHLTRDATERLVTSCILSRLDYCNSILMGCATNVIKPLQQVQNWAARLVLGAPRSDPATPLLRTLHWLPVSERIKYKVGCMCFNVVTNNAPRYLTELLPLYSNLEKLRSSNDTRKFAGGKFRRKTHGYRAFECYAPTFWNSLPYNIRYSPSIETFKSRLKTYLFNKYFRIR